MNNTNFDANRTQFHDYMQARNSERGAECARLENFSSPSRDLRSGDSKCRDAYETSRSDTSFSMPDRFDSRRSIEPIFMDLKGGRAYRISDGAEWNGHCFATKVTSEPAVDIQEREHESARAEETQKESERERLEEAQRMHDEANELTKDAQGHVDNSTSSFMNFRFFEAGNEAKEALKGALAADQKHRDANELEWEVAKEMIENNSDSGCVIC